MTINKISNRLEATSFVAQKVNINIELDIGYTEEFDDEADYLHELKGIQDELQRLVELIDLSGRIYSVELKNQKNQISFSK